MFEPTPKPDAPIDPPPTSAHPAARATPRLAESTPEDPADYRLAQGDFDDLMQIASFIKETEAQQRSLVGEIRSAILDSAKLSLSDWKNLRECLHDIEELIPHIDLIISLKERMGHTARR